MNEFELKDYGQARSLADAIKNNADNIMGIFDSIDGIMKTLYGEAYESTGADDTYSRYKEIRGNYQIFYDNIINVHEHIHSVTESKETTDKRVSSDIASV